MGCKLITSDGEATRPGSARATRDAFDDSPLGPRRDWRWRCAEAEDAQRARDPRPQAEGRDGRPAEARSACQEALDGLHETSRERSRWGGELVPPAGFEPATTPTTSRALYPLSYGGTCSPRRSTTIGTATDNTCRPKVLYCGETSRAELRGGSLAPATPERPPVFLGAVLLLTPLDGVAAPVEALPLTGAVGIAVSGMRLPLRKQTAECRSGR